MSEREKADSFHKKLSLVPITGDITKARQRWRQGSAGDNKLATAWHLDEVFVKVNGKLCHLWRAVDHEGEVLESVVTAKRDKAAAVKFLKRIMKKYGRPRKIVTDGLRAYSAAMREVGNADRQEVGRGLNNRAENSHQPCRRRERAMQRFRSMKTLQRLTAKTWPPGGSPSLRRSVPSLVRRRGNKLRLNRALD